jgi:hypothetical protein
MTTAPIARANVKQAVPFFGVTNMATSLRFYVDGLGFKMKHWWIPDGVEDKPNGRIRWCWLELGDAAIMLQEFLPGHLPKETLGTGIGLLHVRRCTGALSPVQITWNPDTETSVCWKPPLGSTTYRS